MHGAVYLDHNATTPIRPEARRAVEDALARAGNPSSAHRFGRAARRMVEDAREQIAALAGATPENVVFTSGGTEANALALAGSGRARILVSAVEHPSVLAVLAAAPGAEIIPVNGAGIVELDRLAEMLASSSEPALVSIMLANNETGVIQPVAKAAEIARRRGAIVHCDAIQAAGKIAIDMRALGVHLLSLSGHKFGGPMGTGALIVDDSVSLAALQKGGGQERGRRAGTENVPGIAGLGAAAVAARAGLPAFAELAALRDEMEARALSAVGRAEIVGRAAARLPNTSCIALPGLTAETQVMALDLAGVAVGAGAACSSGKSKTSPVLAAMGLGADVASGAIRVSLGWTSGK
ncbi:MAG: cysteine desulfurase, partial [Alphaproteobacteria bacterium]|nr:cysteine desulfurase [Alphaproteobacteria bacterium]